MFARLTKTDIKPMFENELETFATDIVQQGRNNAPVLAIKIHQCKIAAKPRPPGVETPGYSLSSLKGLKVLY